MYGRQPLRSALSTLYGARHYATKAADMPPKISSPIGLRTPPHTEDNTGVDDRTLKQKKDDMLDYDKNLARRKQIEKELAKGTEDLRMYRKYEGKFFLAPPAYFRADKALYMPNFWGKTLTGEWKPTTEILRGHVSVVRIFGSVMGEKFVNSFIKNSYEGAPKEKGFQVVDVNVPDSFLKEQLVRLFMPKIRKGLEPEQHGRYFVGRKGITPELRETIWAKNVYGGYVYLVDRHCRIRWAGCGQATEQEVGYLHKFIDSVLKEKS